MPKVKTFVLSPSDFGFLYTECKRCYYNKYVNKVYRPRFAFPGIFTVIDKLMTSYFDNKPTTAISEDLPPGIITLGGITVRSKPIPCKEYNCELVLEGRVDSLFQFDSGSIGVIDFKTTDLYKNSYDLYFHQLMSYLVALEHNDPEKTVTCKVDVMGLCCFGPDKFDKADDGMALFGQIKWIEIPRDNNRFKSFLREVAGLLTGDSPPPADDCKYCKYAIL